MNRFLLLPSCSLLLACALARAMPCEGTLTEDSPACARVGEILGAISPDGFSHREPTGRELRGLLARHLPVSTEGRRAAVTMAFGSELAHGLDLTGSPEVFAHTLVQALGVSGQVAARGPDGVFLLQHALLGREAPPVVPVDAARVDALLADSALGFPVDWRAPATRDLLEIITARVGLTPEDRAARVSREFGSDVVISIDFEGPAANFAHQLVERLACAGRLKSRAPDGEPILLRVLR